MKLTFKKKSRVHGYGMFAARSLRGSQDIGWALKRVKHTGIPDRDYVRSDLTKFMNHSDSPNVKLLKKKSNLWVFIIEHNIRAGEELFVDYRTFPFEGKIDFAVRSI